MWKPKTIVLATAVFLLAVVVVLVTLNQNPPVQVTGDLTAKEVSQISRDVRRLMHPSLLPDVSWRSIRQLPSVLRERARTRILSIDRRTEGFVAVRTASPSDADPGRFWSVFREGDIWRVDGARPRRLQFMSPVRTKPPGRLNGTNTPPPRLAITNLWAKAGT